MVVDILIVYFLASFIPPIRNYFKKQLKKMYIFIGMGLGVVSFIMSFWVYPKLANLLVESQIPSNSGQSILFLIIGFLVASFMVFFGMKYKDFSGSNLKFYTLFGLLVILTWVFMQIMITVIINPIYKLTSSN